MKDGDRRRGRWTFFVASRYFSSKRKDKNLASSVLSVVGIAVGTMTLITVLAVMNGFQIGFIEDILEINSFHLRIPGEGITYQRDDIEAIRSVRGVQSVIPVVETQTMVKTDFSDFQPCIVRGVPPDISEFDPSMLRQLNIVRGNSTLGGEKSILLGIELANYLGVTIGDEINMISLSGGEFASIQPKQKQFQVTGLFKSGYYEYDRGMGFISLSAAADIVSNNDRLIYGIKLENRYSDKAAAARLRMLPAAGKADAGVTSWREYNSSFFGALRMEKIAMMVLIGLIFLVVGGNIYQSLKRTVMEKIEEISLLKSVGASAGSIQRVFIYDGIFIGLSGGLSGLLLGLLIAFNINTVFTVFERVSNAVLYVVLQIVNPLFGSGIDEVSIFSPRYYYMSEVPVTLPYAEAMLIFLFAFLSSTAAAYFASKKISTIKPSEVLHYE
jgi:lipoprotein-releasing system permease protein